MSDEKPNSYKDLIVWQKGIILVKQIYRLTKDFPNDEKFGLISQMRRVAVSIPSNIAEGQVRRITPDFIRFISMAVGSLAELNTQIIIAFELEYCKNDNVDEIFSMIDELRRMLNALRRTLLAKSN